MYAGYKQEDGTIVGDPANVDFTEVKITVLISNLFILKLILISLEWVSEKVLQRKLYYSSQTLQRCLLSINVKCYEIY